MNTSVLSLFPSTSDSMVSSQGMVVYGSNDPEILVTRCMEDLKSFPLGPFVKEEFLVQSKGMGTWLKLKIAEKSGVFSNTCFRFPEETIWLILRGFLGCDSAENLYTKEGIAWAIYEILEELIHSHPGSFSPLISYMGKNWDQDRAFRLSRQIATLYDSYLAYRPEMIIDWSGGGSPSESHSWQAILWQELRQKMGVRSLPELVREISKLNVPKNPDVLPKRLSVFGVSTLPPLFLDVLQSYAQAFSLRIYSLQPAPLMWGDVKSEKWKLRALQRIEGFEQSSSLESDLHIETGNPLIGSMGRTGRDFFNLLIDRDAHDVALDFRIPSNDSLLANLQRWIFEVFEEKPSSPFHYCPDDSSLLIKSCHSPMRETEVLRDFLLQKFAEDETLLPSDVLVMTPSPESYAPFIRATFGDMEAGMPAHFPYSIVDREPRHESQLVDFFFNLLEFFDGRATNREVLDLLDSLPMRINYGWADEDVDSFRKWIRESHAYWGFDAQHRESLGSSSSQEHTWKHALDRMVLGFCMRGRGQKTWEGVLPYDEIEGENVHLFSELFQVLQQLHKHQERSRSALTLAQWKEFLLSLSRTFFPVVDENLLDRRRIEQAIYDLESLYSHIAPTARVPLRVIRYHLANVVEAGAPKGQFLTHGVTFCGLRPMRSINARIICMIGMNDEAFPRQNHRPSFDLSGDRRPGDRSTREDDRYLFLESIWCARDILYLSYLGQSIRQSEKIPPSVVINELLDALDKLASFTNSDGGRSSAAKELIEEQTLHAFGAKNFSGQSLNRSYSSDHLTAAHSQIKPLDQIPAFVNSPIDDPSDDNKTVKIFDLVRFFDSPSKSFLVNHLGVNLCDKDGLPADSEPLTLGNLEKFDLKTRLLAIELNHQEAKDLYDLARAEGSLPPGNLGKVWFNETNLEIKEFINRWGTYIEGEKEQPLMIDLLVDGVPLQGHLDGLINQRQVLYRCGKTRPKDRLNAWIQHLIICAEGHTDFQGTAFYGLDKANKFLWFEPLPAEESIGHLKTILSIYQNGKTRPVPFFPATSLAHQIEIAKATDSKAEESIERALSKARSEWMPTDFSHGGRKESELPENRICFPCSPLDQPEFAKLASSVFGPFLYHQKDGRP